MESRDPRNLSELLRRAALQFGEQRALAFAADQLPHTPLSFIELDRTVSRTAAVLRSMGFVRGDRIGLLLHNSPALIILWLAAASLGLVTVPLNSRYRPRELAYVIRQSRIRGLFTSGSRGAEPDLAARVQEGLPGAALTISPQKLELPDAPALEHFIALDTPEARSDPLARFGQAEEIELPRIDPRDVALIMYTSGTTADPKGCLITHDTLLRAGRAMAQQRYHLTVDDRMWNPLPMFHMSSLHPFIACLWSGCTFLSMTHFDAQVAARQVIDERVTILYPAFPTIANELLAVDGFAGESLTQLRRINCVAPPDGLRRLQQSFPQASVTSVYGLTEAGGVVAYGEAAEPLDVRISSCGRLFDGIEARIVPLEDRAAAQGESIGEIQLKGWCLFAGYFDQPEATRAVLTEDGWLRTGDVGSIDSERRIRYRGRLKDVIKVGGENVSALEIESVLMLQSAVKLAQVVGVPDERHGEVPVAFVELHHDQSVDAEVLLDHCRRELARFKVPRRLLFVSEWPMSTTKIQKHRLRERLENGGLDG